MSRITGSRSTDWYVKWFASIMMVGAMSVRGVDGYQNVDLALSIIGVIGWFWVSCLWKDRALILVNGIGLTFLLRNAAEMV